MQIENLNIAEMSEVGTALGAPIRANILKLLSGVDIANVDHIASCLMIKPALASHHLKALKEAKLVNRIPSGRSAYYELNSIRLQQVASTLQEMFSTFTEIRNATRGTSIQTTENS